MLEAGFLGPPAAETMIVVLLGASEYPRKPAWSNSVLGASARAFRDYVLSPTGFALAPGQVLDLFDDEADPVRQLFRVEEFLATTGKNAHDLVVYYVGHGGFDNDEYYLGVRSTQRDREFISTIESRKLAKIIREGFRRKRVYVILDSCFSASAASDWQGDEIEVAVRKMAQPLPRQGTVFLAAASKYDVTRAPRAERYTVFTGAVLEALLHGVNSTQPKISMYELYEEVRDVLQRRETDEEGRPELHVPSQREGDIAQLPLFPNAAYLRAAEARIPDEVPVRTSDVAVARAQIQAAEKAVAGVRNEAAARHQVELISPRRTGWVPSASVASVGRYVLGSLASVAKKMNAGLIVAIVAIVAVGGGITLVRHSRESPDVGIIVRPIDARRPEMASIDAGVDILAPGDPLSAKSAPDPKPTAPDFQEHYERAVSMYLSEHYGEALEEFKAAYAAKMLPRLLINIGNVHRKLGQPQEALHAYEEYLKVEPQPDLAVQKKVDKAQAQARAMIDEARADLAQGPGAKLPAAKANAEKANAQPRRPEPSFDPVVTRLERFSPKAYNRPGLEAVAGGPEGLWVVGAVGTIARYDGKVWSDGASSWSELVRGGGSPAPGAGDLHAVWGSSPSDVWAVGRGGLILHYDGTSWYSVASGTKNDLRGVWGRGVSDVWVMDAEGGILRFDGTEWVNVTAEGPARSQVARVFALSPKEVWAVGREGTVLRWNGQALAEMVSGTTKNLYAVWAAGPMDVWAAGEEGTLLHFDGKAWKPVPSGVVATLPPREQIGGRSPTYTPTNHVRGLWGSGPRDVWAVGGADGVNQGFVLHWDGKTWSPSLPQVKGIIKGVWGSGPRDVWALGEGLLHHDGSSWSPMPTRLGLRDAWGSGASDVWAVGEDGTIVHFDGKEWSARYSRTSSALRAVARVAADDVWIVGNDGIRHFDGKSLQVVPCGTTEGLLAVWATKDNAWAAGANGTLLHWDGRAWKKVPLATKTTFVALWGSGPDDVWLAGDKDALFHYDGRTWTPQTVDAKEEHDFRAIAGSASNDVWLVAVRRSGGPGYLLRWDGQAWKPVALPGTDVSSVWSTGRRDVWVIARAGEQQVLRWDGKAWSRIRVGTKSTLNSVWSPAPGEAWAVGSDATVVRYRAK